MEWQDLEPQSNIVSSQAIKMILILLYMLKTGQICHIWISSQGTNLWRNSVVIYLIWWTNSQRKILEEALVNSATNSTCSDRGNKYPIAIISMLLPTNIFSKNYQKLSIFYVDQQR